MIAGSDSNITDIRASLPFLTLRRAALGAAVETVSVDVVPGIIEVWLNEQPSWSLEGTEQVSDTRLLKEFCGVTEMVYAAEVPGLTEMLFGKAPMLKLGGGGGA